jgi:hypothetical protein
VFTTVSALVDQLADNPAGKMTTQEIAAKVERTTQVVKGVQAAA